MSDRNLNFDKIIDFVQDMISEVRGIVARSISDKYIEYLIQMHYFFISLTINLVRCQRIIIGKMVPNVLETYFADQENKFNTTPYPIFYVKCVFNLSTSSEMRTS
jgi:hypothetical protein